MPGLSTLGLTELEEMVYRHFLRHPAEDAADLGVLLGATDAEVESAVESLRGLDLLHGPPGRLEPREPGAAVDLLTERRLRRLTDEMRELSRTRHLITELEQLRPGSDLAEERLDDVDRVRERLADLAFFAREEILSIESQARYSSANIDHARPLDLRCLRRGVAMRSLVHSAMLQDRASAAYLRELGAAGLQVRHATDLTGRVLVYDRRTALVPIDPGDTSRGALVLRDPALVSTLISLFERSWAAAAPVPAAGGDDARDRELSETERAVLRSMCAVSKDETGAREMGVSVRTYRRYVADLLRRLGATNRAQAALLARERGWV